MSEHYINVCSCGAVINQCRCTGNKTRTVVPNGCPKCKSNHMEDRGQYTVDYFSNLLEAMMKGTRERCYRRIRMKPGDPIRPVDTDPEKSVIHGLQHDADNNPMKTGRGKASVRRQARENQRHPERFAEAIEFIREYAGEDRVLDQLDSIRDKRNLKMLVGRLLSQPNTQFREWLEAVNQSI